MIKFKNYCKRFVKEDDGFEFLQVAIVIAIVAVLAGVVWGIAVSAQGKLNDAQTELDKIQVNPAP